MLTGVFVFRPRYRDRVKRAHMEEKVKQTGMNEATVARSSHRTNILVALAN